MANEIPKLLTIREFAKVLRIHRNTVYKLIACGKVPRIQLGDRTTRIPVTAITSKIKTAGGRHA